MNPACDMCQFLEKPLKNQIITTAYWTAGIIPNQAYLGRALLSLRTHKASIGELSREEWQDFETIVRGLETAYQDAFGAKPLNIGAFMNHGYRADPPHPHVHWQIFPRYKQPVDFAGLRFEDKLYGNFYDDAAEQIVSDEVVSQIVSRLQASL